MNDQMTRKGFVVMLFQFISVAFWLGEGRIRGIELDDHGRMPRPTSTSSPQLNFHSPYLFTISKAFNYR